MIRVLKQRIKKHANRASKVVRLAKGTLKEKLLRILKKIRRLSLNMHGPKQAEAGTHLPTPEGWKAELALYRNCVNVMHSVALSVITFEDVTINCLICTQVWRLEIWRLRQKLIVMISLTVHMVNRQVAVCLVFMSLPAISH